MYLESDMVYLIMRCMKVPCIWTGCVFTMFYLNVKFLLLIMLYNVLSVLLVSIDNECKDMLAADCILYH